MADEEQLVIRKVRIKSTLADAWPSDAVIHTLYRTPNFQEGNHLSELLLQNICFIVLEYVGLDVKIEYLRGAKHQQ